MLSKHESLLRQEINLWVTEVLDRRPDTFSLEFVSAGEDHFRFSLLGTDLEVRFYADGFLITSVLRCGPWEDSHAYIQRLTKCEVSLRLIHAGFVNGMRSQRSCAEAAEARGQ